MDRLGFGGRLEKRVAGCALCGRACGGGRRGAWRASDARRSGSVRAYVEAQGRGQADREAVVRFVLEKKKRGPGSRVGHGKRHKQIVVSGGKKTITLCIHWKAET